MNKTEALVGLNLILDIGSIRLKRLLEVFETPEKILSAAEGKLSAVYGIGEKIAQKITGLNPKDIEKEFSLAKKFGLKIITPEDAGYPKNLKQIPDPPIILYVKGKITPQDESSIAIVGSRIASIYGLTNAGKIAADLALADFTVVSGLARGIDTAAHRGALAVNGRTLAVIGSGFNQLYPPENRELAEEIARRGAVISEFPIDTLPFKQNFPRRNRVISGLSLGVLVAEAARNSGALITADFALEQGREVFALPGKLDAENSFGVNELIKQGAKLVTSVEDILEEFEDMQNKNPQVQAKDDKSFLVSGLVQEEAVLYNLISRQPQFFDEIVENSRMGIPQVCGLLLKLQLRKLIKELPGKQFVTPEHK